MSAVHKKTLAQQKHAVKRAFVGNSKIDFNIGKGFIMSLGNYNIYS